MITTKKIALLFGTTLLLISSAAAQDSLQHIGVDELFKIARNEAFKGTTEKARIYLQAILQRKPGYNEVRTFLGRTYSWDGKRDSARIELKQVLSNDPDNEEALVALVDVETWDDQHEVALELANKGLQKNKGNEELLYRKARSLVKLKREKEAVETLQDLFIVNPGHKDGSDLLKSVKEATIKNTLTINFARDVYSETFDPSQQTSFQIGRRTGIGSIMLRANLANRFGTNGNQIELDAYPSLFKGVYGYINLGHSETSLFPQNRLGGEVYFKLPRSFEGSAGFRYLYFGGGSQVTLYTATLGKYIGNYWLSLRTFITPGGAGTSNSYLLLTRRYFKNAENYLGIVAGIGFSPDFRAGVQSAERIATNKEAIVVLRSRRVALDYQNTLGIHWLYSIMYNLSFQEYPFKYQDEGYILIHGPQLSLQYRF